MSFYMFLFYLAYFSGTFTIHRTAAEALGYLFSSSLQLHRQLEITQGITESLPLHIVNRWAL